MCLIYVLKNKINFKLYIGQTTRSSKSRIKSHIKRNSLIGNALRKYGINNFKIYEFYIPEKLLDYFEIELIKRLNTQSPNGYNLESGGNKNKHLHKKTKKKLSIIRMGENNPFYNKTHTKEVRKKISESNMGDKNFNYGKKFSKEYRKKISKNHSDVSGGKNPSAKKVFCIELNRFWDCAKSAANELNININRLRKCCRGIYKTAGRYHWKYYVE
jgi:group I intron endonuclease